MTNKIITKHGTLIAANGKGILLLGPSGAGKSDLAFRFISTPSYSKSTIKPMLVADDQVELYEENRQIWGQPPKALKGLLEVRHLGIQTVPFLDKCPISLVIQLQNYQEIERYPDNSLEYEILEDVNLPMVQIDPFEASAMNKLDLIFSQL